MLDVRIRKLSLDTIRIVAEVLRLRSLTQVAQLSGISQPAVSLHIRKFEQATGLQVVRRVGNKLVPSIHGDHILGACQGVLESAARISDFSRVGASPRLGMDPGTFALLEHSIKDLTQLTEKFLLVIERSDCLIKRFAEAHLDAVIRPLYPFEARPELAFDTPFHWVGTATHNSPLPKSRSEGKVPVILQPRETPYGSLARTYLTNHAGNYDVVAEAGDGATLCRLLERGLGYAYVPEFLVSTGRAVSSFLPLDLRRREKCSIGIFHHKDAFPFSDVEALLAKISELAKIHPMSGTPSVPD